MDVDDISMKKIAIIDFEYVGSEEILEGHVYLCKTFKGDIIESDGKNKNIFYIYYKPLLANILEN